MGESVGKTASFSSEIGEIEASISRKWSCIAASVCIIIEPSREKGSDDMLTLLFMILMITVFAKLIGLAFRLTWGITKVVLTVVFFPLIMIGMFCV